MRVCLICTEKLPVPPVRGGAIQTYIDAVAPRIARVHDVTVVCRNDPSMPEEEMVGPVRFIRLPSHTGSGNTATALTSPATYYRRVASWLAAQPRFDLVVMYNRPAYVREVAAAARGARFALSMHNDMFDFDRLPRPDGRAALDRADLVLCVSDFVRRNIDRLHPGRGRKLKTVYAGVDTVRFSPVWKATTVRSQVRKRLGFGAGDLVVLHVSRFSARKGNRMLLDAMEQVLPDYPQARLLVVGSSRYGTDDLDDYGRAFRSDAEARLGEAVRFTGFVPPADVADLYLAGDLFVVTSQWQEPLARVHYEAMAAGLPIVTTDRGGNCEVIEEGASALVARPHDSPRAFAAQIKRLLDDSDLREQLGRRGRELAEERYTWDRVAGELLAIFAARG